MSDNDKNKIVTIAKGGIGIEIDEAVIEKYLRSPLLWFTEVTTGLATYEKKDYILTGGQLIQGAIKNDFWNEFLHQLNELREKGRSKRKFYKTRHGRINFNELFNYINKNDTPEEEVFKAMKAIFLNSIDIAADEKEEIRAYHLLQTCKKLHSIDILVLKSAFKLYGKYKPGGNTRLRDEVWENTIAEMINVPVNLVRLSRRQHSEAEGTADAWLFSLYDEEPAGLTGLGIDLAKFLMEEKK